LTYFQVREVRENVEQHFVGQLFDGLKMENANIRLKVVDSAAGVKQNSSSAVDDDPTVLAKGDLPSSVTYI